jgi:DNA-binding beta-propeller fold protein YncE
VARQAFPEAIDRPVDGLNLPRGARVARYVADNAAQVVLPEGKRAIAESTGPLAVETGGGRRAPVDLGLLEKGGVFESARPVVGVVIPAHASQSVQLPEAGITLTQVDGAGNALGGAAGRIDGASVLYANTLRDSDTVVRPTPAGFSADAILRSVNSPDRLYFRLGVPAGATVKQVHAGVSPVVVSVAGRVLASVLPPVAHDAAGAIVPVFMTSQRNMLVVSVSAQGEHLWPIAVDPEVIDTNLVERESPKLKSNWVNEYSNATLFYNEPTISETIVKMSNASMEPGEWMATTYPTQGESRIFNAEAWVYEQVLHGRSRFQILKSGAAESENVLDELGSAEWRPVSLCAHHGESPCKSTGGSSGNVLRYKQEEIEPESNLNALYSVFGYTKVYITQEKGPELSFNNTSSLIDEGRINVMYGGGGWLSPTSGAVEMIAHDPGVGVSRAGAQELSGGNYHTQIFIYNENLCKGVQCKETFINEITYSPRMSDGEDQFELWGEDEMGYFGYLGGGGVEVTVKVDGTAPHALKVSGWNAAHEISAASHSLTFEATDGEGTTPSSGVAAISVSVDGGPYSGVPIAPCSVSSGPCTSSGKWTLDAEGLSEGVHSLIVTAKDNAGNEESEEFTFDVRHGSPVLAGPGTVDPTTGQFKLTANDVSLAGAGSLSRTFESNNLSAGAEGPFGPQWAGSLGDGQGLTVLVNGSVVLKSPSGGTTTFSLNEKKEYESPPGDGNLKIEAKEEASGKGITEYLLVETKTGFTTSFKQPSGMGNTTPIYAGQFGSEAGHLSMPGGMVADSSGDLWVADWGNSRIVKFSPQGAVLGIYGSAGPYSGELLHPRDLTINPNTGNVYVADEGNNRVVELNSKGEFVTTFGWGVSNGKTEYQICTTNCQAGTAGSGNGQFYALKGLTLDGSGNVWANDQGNNRIEEFTSTGAFVQKWGSEGTAEGYIDGAVGLVFSGEHLWVAEALTNRVQEFSTSGTYLGHFGKAGTGNGEFSSPRGITVDAKTGNFYVADGGNHRVQEFSSSGSYVAQFGSAGGGSGQFGEPKAVAINTSGNIYVTDWLDNRVAEWTRPTWLPTISENALKSPSATYSYEAVQVEGKTVIQPTEELAPVPAHVSCGTKPSELKKGCRALTFVYDTGATTAGNGSSPSEWGNYKGRLEKVKLHVWDPSKSEMTEPTVAEYRYDGQGRLRAQWDPRISPALKTTYGYDEEGHVTSVSPPGQEPWLIHYAPLAGDVNNGRLLSITRPAAGTSETVKSQKAMSAPTNTVAPKLSTTTPAVGTTVSVSSEGSWSNTPLAYSYQWYDCTTESAEWKTCTAISGAVNKEYTPQARDAGYYLLGRVTAQNSTGAAFTGTAPSKKVPLVQPSFVPPAFGSKGSGVGQMENPQDNAIDASGHVWVADGANNRIDEFSTTGTFMEAIGWGVSDGKSEAEICTTTCRAGLAGSGHGQFSFPVGVAINQNHWKYIYC